MKNQIIQKKNQGCQCYTLIDVRTDINGTCITMNILEYLGDPITDEAPLHYEGIIYKTLLKLKELSELICEQRILKNKI